MPILNTTITMYLKLNNMDLNLKDLLDVSFMDTVTPTQIPNGVMYKKDNKTIKITGDDNRIEVLFTYSPKVCSKTAKEFKKYIEDLPDDIFESAVEIFGDTKELDALVMKGLNSSLKNESESELINKIKGFKNIVKNIIKDKINDYQVFLR